MNERPITMDTNVELVLDSRSELGEGAVWHAPSQVLYWVDIVGEMVHVYDPATGSNRTIDIGQSTGTVVPRTGGGVAVALHHGFYNLDLETGELTPIVDPEEGSPNRFNDGKCDPAGRFWAGTMPYDSGAPTDGGALWCLHADGASELMLSGVQCSNGIAWSLDSRTMYYIDTPTMHVRAYDYDVTTGAISGERVVVTVPESDGVPDGMTIDSEGMLWVAHWGGWQVVRWNPATGEKLDAIRVPSEKVTSCAFGGEDLGDLYITTARAGVSDDEAAEQPNAGGLFRARPGVTGIEAYEFTG